MGVYVLRGGVVYKLFLNMYVARHYLEENEGELCRFVMYYSLGGGVQLIVRYNPYTALRRLRMRGCRYFTLVGDSSVTMNNYHYCICEMCANQRLATV